MVPRSSLALSSSAAAQALADLATVKSDLGISDTSQDARLTRLIAASAGAFVKYCGRPFIQQTYVETWRLPTSPSQYWQAAIPLDPVAALPPSVWPVVSITSIVEAGTTLSSTLYNNDKPLDPAQPGRGFLRLDTSGAESAWARGVIVATYVAGFNAPTVTGGNMPLPADLYEAAILDVRARFYAKDRDPSQVVTREEVPDVYVASYDVTAGLSNLGGSSATFGIAAAALITLDAYRAANWA